MITHKGIEVNPDKCKGVMPMRSPTYLKVQRLKEKLVAMSHILTKLAEKSKPLFKLVKGAEVFYWNEECETMFMGIKTKISLLPILINPPPHSTLAVYLAVSTSVISSVLVY